MKKRSFEKRAASNAYNILIAYLLLLNGIFTLSAFIPTDNFWGISYLYHMPDWAKILFLIFSWVIFVPSINGVFYKTFTILIDSVDRLQKKIRIRKYSAIIPVLSILAIGGILYKFRVFSLYHDITGGLYMMERDYSVADFFRDSETPKHKVILMVYVLACRYILYQKMGLSSYMSLAVPSIIVGILYVLLLVRLIRKFNLSPFMNSALFILTFTHTITYFYFGYASTYVLIPLFILIYVYALIKYFTDSISIIFPLMAAMMTILLHIGTMFILFSVLFLIIHKFRVHFVRLYDLLIFRNPENSILILGGLLCLLYIGLVFLSDHITYLSAVLVQPFNPADFLDFGKSWGWPFFSREYFIHLVNMFVLSSPVGVILFPLCIRWIHDYKNLNDSKYALLWIAIGGILHIILNSPRTLYVWEDYVWTSFGYILLGALLFLHIMENVKFNRYIITVALGIAAIYFSAWIGLHNNLSACINNYLDHASSGVSQTSYCIRMIGQDIRDTVEARAALSVLEARAKEEEEFYELIVGYDSIKDSVSKVRVLAKYYSVLEENILKTPDVAYLYYRYIRVLNTFVKKNEDVTMKIGELYDNLMRLEPENVHYLDMFGEFLMREKKFRDAIYYFQRADSIFSAGEISIMKTNITHNFVLGKMVEAYYGSGEYLQCIGSYGRMVPMKTDFSLEKYRLPYEIAVRAYVYISNIDKSESMIEKSFTDGYGVFRKPIDLLMRNMKVLCIVSNISEQIAGFIDNSEWDQVINYCRVITEDNRNPDCIQFEYLHSMLVGDYDKVIDDTRAALKHDDKDVSATVFLALGYAARGKSDSSLSILEAIHEKDKQFSYSWMIPYMMLLQNRRQEAGKQCGKLLDENKDMFNRAILQFIKDLGGMPNDKIHPQKAVNAEGKVYSEVHNERSFFPQIERLVRESPPKEMSAVYAKADSLSKEITKYCINQYFLKLKTTLQKELLDKSDELLVTSDYMGVFDFVGFESEIIYQYLKQVNDYERKGLGSVFNYTQKFIVESNIDSLNLYSRKFIDTAPSLFMGYLLKGVAEKKVGNYKDANQYLDSAIVKVMNNPLGQDAESLIKRIETVKTEFKGE